MIPLVSIVMPIYRSNESYLREAILSVLMQSYSNFELIIVNDSPDEEVRLAKIITSYNDKRIIWLNSKTNAGIATAYNKGIDCAQGEFIAMLDHDDICLPNRLSLQVEFLLANLTVGFVGGQAYGLYENGDLVELNYTMITDKTQLKQVFLNEVPFLNPSIMFRRSALTTLRYNPKYKVCADYDLFARLIFEHAIEGANLPQVILHYRLHSANASFNQYLLAEQETKQIQDWILTVI